MDIEGENEAAAGGPGFLQLNGTTYLVGQPTAQDMAALHRYFRERLQNPLAAIAGDLESLPPQYRAAAIKAAVELRAGGGAELTPGYVGEQLLQPHGCAMLAWLLIRKNHPEVTLEKIAPHVTAENASDVLAKLGAASGMAGVTDPKAAGRTGS
jgi:hypothetical protein